MRYDPTFGAKLGSMPIIPDDQPDRIATMMLNISDQRSMGLPVDAYRASGLDLRPVQIKRHPNCNKDKETGKP